MPNDAWEDAVKREREGGGLMSTYRREKVGVGK